MCVMCVAMCMCWWLCWLPQRRAACPWRPLTSRWHGANNNKLASALTLALLQIQPTQGVPGVHAAVWLTNFISFYFLYPSTFNILEVRAANTARVAGQAPDRMKPSARSCIISLSACKALFATD